MHELLAEACNSIAPTTGDLIPQLKARLTDTNRNLAIDALDALAVRFPDLESRGSYCISSSLVLISSVVESMPFM